MSGLILSDEQERIAWSDVLRFCEDYGVKGATSLAIPRPWTPPFALMSVDQAVQLVAGTSLEALVGQEGLEKLIGLAGTAGQLIVRSSVVGESIWDRGSYDSIPVAAAGTVSEVTARIVAAASKVLSSTEGRKTGLMIQRHVRPVAQGEFGNLLRVSKTRDHWEISTREHDGATSRARLNSQRDRASAPNAPLLVRAGLSRERLFGSIGAWLNNELLLGQSRRLNCEWITDNQQYFLVQVDEEDEDLTGVNPFQVRIPPAGRPEQDDGQFLKWAGPDVLQHWDKLQVLEQLWEVNAAHKPTLFYLPLADLPDPETEVTRQQLENDFRQLIGPLGIIVRTSVRAGADKIPNLPRTECLTPEDAAGWCFEIMAKLKLEYNLSGFAFVAHRFVAANASAWAKADPNDPTVEINTLWGLPDALQYCPYDIWEVHVQTGHANEYPDYKSDMLIARDDGGWEYVRVKNEFARANSISTVEAKDIGFRSMEIAQRLGRACHIMWFVGCVDGDGYTFNIPWYWTEAHEAERNPDRAAYNIFPVHDRDSLRQFVDFQGSRNRQALALRPTDLNLMRDNGFIKSVGAAAQNAHVPVILSGSTLAHAYYLLRDSGCSVVTPIEKEHVRTRGATNLRKLVRDKIPGRIAERQEVQTTQQIEGGLRKGFLLGKLLEEALEVREAATPAQKTEELADLFEVFRAIAKAEKVSLTAIKKAADEKKKKAGGFEEGLVLVQTAIPTPGHSSATETEREIGDVLGDQGADDTAQVPFTFFGFAELDQPRSLYFNNLGVRLDLVLRPDRLEIRLVRTPDQPELPLS